MKICGELLVVVFICGIYWMPLLTGCNQPQLPAVSNIQHNEITEREGLVSAFGTAEVVGIPSDSHEFLVRDTNGVVWYVSTRGGTEGSTRMFGWHEEFPKPVLPLSVTITNWVTNSVIVTNTVVEDPLQK